MEKKSNIWNVANRPAIWIDPIVNSFVKLEIFFITSNQSIMTCLTFCLRRNHALKLICCCSVTQSCLTLWPHKLQHARLPCPSPSPGTCSNSCPLIQWCHPTISSSVVPFSFRLQSFPASGSFLMSQLFAPGGQSIGASASASVLPINI